MNAKINSWLVGSALLVGGFGLAMAASDAPTAPAVSVSATAAPGALAKLTLGEVRKIDTEQGKLTIKHGPIENLQMPGLTMVFKAADPAMLQKLQVGDKIEFAAEKANGAIVVTTVQAAK